jgi:predicted nucleic acid-binding protein
LKAYADTSFLVSLYVDDDHTEIANAWVKRRVDSLPFTPLHRHEFRNAIRAAVWRQQIDRAERGQVFRQMEGDLKAGFLEHQPVGWKDAFREAERIGEMQAEQTGVRAADLLHIAIASVLDAEKFLTFDMTQRKAAIGAGFECRP